MKAIVIKESNRDRINAAIKEAEGKATARTIGYDDIVSELSWLESFWKVPKKALTGSTVWVDTNAQTFPGAYNYIPESTHFKAKKTASGWSLVDVCRFKCGGPRSEFQVTLTDEAREAIIKVNMNPCR